MESRQWNLAYYYLIRCSLISSAFVTSSLPGIQSVTCNDFKTCSQKCDMIGDNPQCSCADDYQLKNDNKTCVPNDPNWILLFTNTHIIFSLSGSGNNFTNLAPPKKIMTYENQASSIQCLTSDVKSNVIYWTNGAENQKRITKMNLENNTRSNLAYSGLHSPNGIAFDWITSNLYLIDSQMSCIVVCSTRSANCATVVQEPLNQINQPIDIALHPNEGIMFWTNVGYQNSINRASMDGSNITQIVLSNLYQPRGITVDLAASRIYWTDVERNIIETTRFDGSNRENLYVSDDPNRIDILGNMLFWNDPNGYIKTDNKFGRRWNEKTLFHDKYIKRGLTIMHTAKQPSLRDNPCENSQCSYMCVLAGNTSQCLCPVGMVKRENDCLDDDNRIKLLVAQENNLLMYRIGTIGTNVFQNIPLPPQIKMIKALIYNPKNNSVIISEATLNIIVEFKLETEEYTVLVNDDVGNVTLMSIDVIGENLIWYDAGKQTIEAMSLATGARVILVSDAKMLHDILFVPEHRSLYFSKDDETGKYTEVFRMYFFLERPYELFQRFPIDVSPVHLVFDQEKKSISMIFLKAPLITIRTISGSWGLASDIIRKSFAKILMDAVQIKSQIFYVTETYTVYILGTIRLDSRYFDSLAGLRTNLTNFWSFLPPKKFLAVMDRNIAHLQERRSNSPCSPENPNKKACSHLCLPGFYLTDGECKCPANLVLSNDGLNCVQQDRESETTSKQFDGNVNQVETQSVDCDDYSTTVSILQSSVNYSDSLKISKRNDNSAVTGFLIVFAVIIIILIVVGITVFLVIKQLQEVQVPLVPKPYVANSSLP